MKTIYDYNLTPSDTGFEQIRNTIYPIDKKYIHAFEYICVNGCYELARLLWEKSNGGFEFDVKNIVIQSFYNGNVDTVKWLMAIKPIDLSEDLLNTMQSTQEQKINAHWYKKEEREKFKNALEWLYTIRSVKRKPIEMIII